ncbi:hypothetical protein [Candidatus Poriferisodalis sp.]|uniref:hypothetical protein n=1 Tax=Candidatus Poriferisodalis sp. TaxID=3101277 RepID=UPI003B017359
MSCEERPENPLADDDSSLISIGAIGNVRLTDVAAGACTLTGPAGTAVDPYAEMGPPPLGHGGWKSSRQLSPLLDAWMTNLQYFSNEYGTYGSITTLYHNGMFVKRAEQRTFHNVGRAIDIKGIDWAGGQIFRPCAGNEEMTPLTRYRWLVGVEASLRKYFGNVLPRGYPSHADHYHADDGCPVGFSTAKETNRLFARDCIRAFTSNPLSIKYDSRDWDADDDNTDADESGTDTRALNALLAAMGMDCFDINRNVSEFLIFLDYIMMHAFADQSAGHYRWGGLIDL